ncbi:RNA polymerase sigma factor [Dyadobacter sp. MSC1_007]|jgi:RNA polymerase sigma factor (sigma-70 family)|uniref:RNA polymerase sigma factor n=1 Tax=Dyadobacter sp. MSC1_007 TaxID=2909264 RepID=UPI0020306D12|nr:sigma-70 family RNA polymerase sigma factor [Dyadobacter sp. MSC1_007]
MKPFISNHSQQEEEIVLWRAMLGGDMQGYEALINRTYDLLFHYGGKFSRDRELVKDCIQDVYLEVWEKRNALSSDIPPKAYLLASLRRRMHRVSARHRMDCMDYYNEADIVFEAEFDAEYRLIQLEEDRLLASRMTRMLNDLPKRQKEAVFLKFYNNMERDEIALIMDIHPQSVSNLLQEAFKCIKSQWKAIITAVMLLCFSA